MKAILLNHEGLTYRPEYPEPVPQSGEVMVDVIEAGICETDLQLAEGYMGFSGIPGHEFVGVARAGKHAGCRVVGEINCNCRRCSLCQSGLGNHCPRRTVIGIDRHDGAFAERLAIPEHCLHRVPDSISNDQAVLTEPLAAALQISEQLDLSAFRSATVLGDGRLAFLIAQTLRHDVAQLTVVGKHPNKLERFRQRGITTVLLDDLERKQQTDLVVDVTGSTTGLPLALQLVRPRGTVVMKTTVAAQHQLSLAAVVIHEIQIVGSRCGPFDRALQWLAEDRVDVSDLITHRFPLMNVEEAMRAARNFDSFKVVFEIGSNDGR